MWTCPPVRLLTLPVHAACHSDGAPTGRTLLPVLVIHGVLGFICVGGGGGALASCRNRAAVNILGQGPGAHILRSGTSGWDWPQNLQGLIQSKTGGPGINRQEFQHGSCRAWYREQAGRPLGCRTHLYPRRGLSKGPVPCGGPWHTGWSTFPVLTSIGL